jgi:ABC-2 type transport system ATP-binding protein
MLYLSMDKSDFLIEVKNFSKSFFKNQVIKDLSFEVRKGEIFAFLGANGSGKTTTIRSILGIYSVNKGEVTIFGEAFSTEDSTRIGYLPEERGLYLNMTVFDTLVYFAELKKITRDKAEQKATEYLDRVGLGEKKNSKIKELSSGQQQKVQLCVSMVHEPELLILDEPTKGLDPVNRILLMDMILEQKEKGTTVIFSTHIMEEAEKIADRLLILHNGTAAEYGEVKDVRRKHDKELVYIQTDETIERDSKYEFKKVKGGYEILCSKDCTERDILKYLLDKNINFEKVERIYPTIEEVFIKVTSNK